MAMAEFGLIIKEYVQLLAEDSRRPKKQNNLRRL